jgi:hypothetical protein
LLGEAGLVPILEVGAVAAAVAWMSACAAYLRMKPNLRGRAAASFGLLVTALMVLVKVLPVVPGHFTRHEWIALAIWIVLGVLITLPVSGTYRQSRQRVLVEEVPNGTRRSES